MKSTIEAGWKTSEFKVLIVTSAVAIANKAFGWHLDPNTVLTVGGMAISYILSRGIRKRGA